MPSATFSSSFLYPSIHPLVLRTLIYNNTHSNITFIYKTQSISTISKPTNLNLSKCSSTSSPLPLPPWPPSQLPLSKFLRLLEFRSNININNIRRTVTVYACPSSTGLASAAASSGSSAGESSGLTSGESSPSGVAAASGVAAPTASSGVVSSATGTSSPIAYATGAAGHIQVSAFGMVVAGAVALVCLPSTIHCLS